jgi:outer membrane receptor protein involved in Fe transport
MKKILYFVLFLAFSLPSLAAVSIKGKVVDASTQSPLDFVNVTVFKTGNSIPVASVVSNASGDFTLPTVNNGKYSLRISYVGYNTRNQELTVLEKPLNLGTITLEGNAKNLAAVEVIGQGSQMRFDIDKKVFSVDKNISAAGGSASDVLKNIPSVKVDNEGNVSLRKDANVEVWINGKPSGLTADNRAQVLQQMPAESIESIEIMTNPSAKFNPEGTAGIINLVMKKNRKAGYYGSVSAGLMYPTGGKIGQSFGTNINYNSGKIDAYLNIGYRAMNFKGGGNSTRYNNASPALADTILTQNNVMRNSFSGLFVRTGIDYHLNDKNTISIGGFGMAGSGKSNSTLSYLKTDPINNQIIRDYSQTNTGTGTRPSINVNVDFRHDFDSKGNNNLMTSLSYSSHNRGGDNRYQQTDLPSPANDKTQSSDNNNKEFVFKTDYTNKFTETSRFEAGWQSTLSDRLSDASGYYTLTNVSLPEYQNKFDYNEMIHAAYLTYGDRFLEKFSVQGGLRAEYLDKKFTNTTPTDAQTIDPKPTLQLFPSMYLSYTLSKSDEIQLNYTRRVNRPRGRQISPFRDYSDSTSISYGNPNLLPEYSSALELNYLKSWQSHSLSASAYYRITDNVIENVRFFNGGTMENTYMNIAKRQNSGMELVAKDQLFTILSLTTSANLYYSKINSSVYANPYNPTISTTIPGQSTFSWSANMIANLMLSKTMSGQITAEYSSPTLIAQGKESAEYKIDLGLRKTFFNRKLSVNVMAMDIFNFNKEKTITYGTGFYQIAESYFHRRMIGLSVSYNFGNMKPKQTDMKKKAGTGEMNMDMGE